MPKTESLTVVLPEALVAQVHRAVEQGQYQSCNDAVSDALYEWSANRGVIVEDTEWLKQAAREALEDERPPVPMKEVFDRLKARYGAMAGSAAAK
jgi:Arc/MetJ-type ribon-helix-helix transcriptional regulator